LEPVFSGGVWKNRIGGGGGALRRFFLVSEEERFFRTLCFGIGC
jgi:hypothetical protein